MSKSVDESAWTVSSHLTRPRAGSFIVILIFWAPVACRPGRASGKELLRHRQGTIGLTIQGLWNRHRRLGGVVIDDELGIAGEPQGVGDIGGVGRRREFFGVASYRDRLSRQIDDTLKIKLGLPGKLAGIGRNSGWS